VRFSIVKEGDKIARTVATVIVRSRRLRFVFRARKTSTHTVTVSMVS